MPAADIKSFRSSTVKFGRTVSSTVAGRGIVHSERSAPEKRASDHGLHGLQLSVALPAAHEEGDRFSHTPAAAQSVRSCGNGRG